MNISYVTKNPRKYENARHFLNSHGITTNQLSIEVDEIQSGDSLEIATSKAREAYRLTSAPLFVNDASWIIPALNGFPGPFMKYVNEWFSPSDYINLMQDKSDRRIILRDSIVYIDEKGLEVFTHDHEGQILRNPANFVFKHPSDVVISLSKSGKSIAEERELGNHFMDDEDLVWKKFAQWVKARG